jgi:hypothetical protein
MINFKQVTRVALGALVLGFFGAPSCTALPASETMIVLQTDLSLPKDVDRLTIQVLVRGDQRHFNEFTKLGTDDTLKIPASIGLTLDDGTDLSTPVTFRVTAFQGTKARVLREVVTTIPKDRLVALKLPIQWLCWEDLALDPDGNAISNCDANQTCIAGTCTDNKVDPSALDDYSADQVFGGGTGTGDGTCFDTAPCFAAPTDAPTTVDGSDCTINAGKDVNVAIRVDTAGICGSNGCFVPIDANSELGWQASGDKIKLPKAVCDRIAAGKASGVSTSVVNDMCPLKTSAIPTCGPWSSAGKPSSMTAADKLKGVVFNQPSPVSLAVGNGYVYWINSGSFDLTTKGTVNRVPIGGGSASEELAMQGFPNTIAIDSTATHVAWSNTADKTVIYRTIAGKMDATLTLPGSAAPSGLTFFGNDLLVTAQTDNSVFQVFSDKSPAKTLAASGQTSPYRITTDGKFAFWTNEGKGGALDGSIVMHDLSNVLPDSVIQGQDVPRNLTLQTVNGDATAVFWANLAPDTAADVTNMTPRKGAIHKATIAGGVMTLDSAWYPDPQDQALGIFVDASAANRVYWTNQRTGTVWQVENDGTKAQMIASEQNRPGAIVADAEFIYWVNEGTLGAKDGSVMRFTKDK